EPRSPISQIRLYLVRYKNKRGRNKSYLFFLQNSKIFVQYSIGERFGAQLLQIVIALPISVFPVRYFEIHVTNRSNNILQIFQLIPEIYFTVEFSQIHKFRVKLLRNRN